MWRARAEIQKNVMSTITAEEESGDRAVSELTVRCSTGLLCTVCILYSAGNLCSALL